MKALIWFSLVVVSSLAVLAQNRALFLGWNPVSNAEGYFVYYGPQSGEYTNRRPTSVTNAMVMLTPDSSFYFAVTARKGSLESDYSSEVVYSFPSLANTNFNLALAVHPSEGIAELSFTVRPFSTVKVEYSSDLAEWFEFAIVQTESGVVTLTDLESESARFYRARII